MTMNISKALNSLRPESEWTLYGENYEDLVWSDSNEQEPPTEEEINQEIERLQQEWKNNQYQRDRAKEYPTIQDQLDILYHGGLDAWRAEINKVKEQYPKPE